MKKKKLPSPTCQSAPVHGLSISSLTASKPVAAEDEAAGVPPSSELHSCLAEVVHGLSTSPLTASNPVAPEDEAAGVPLSLELHSCLDS